MIAYCYAKALNYPGVLQSTIPVRRKTKATLQNTAFLLMLFTLFVNCPFCWRMFRVSME